MSDAKWYVVHTYSGYEKKVKDNIEKAIENRQLGDVIKEVAVPEFEEFDEKTSKRVAKKVFPGYVLINMVVNDETWFIVRNTRGVTGFVGPASKPVPLTEDEVRSLGLMKGAVVESQFSIGEMVTVISGPWAGQQSKIKTVNDHKQTATITIDMFGRETDVEIDYSEIRSGI